MKRTASFAIALLAGTGTANRDCEGLVEALRRVRGVRVSLTLREIEDGRVKFSLRSHGDDNIQPVAHRFGGGGHANASGGVVAMSLAEAEEALVGAVADLMDLPDCGGKEHR